MVRDIYLLFAVFLGSVTFPVVQYLTPYKSAWPLSQAVKTHLPAGATLYQYGMSLYGIDFYTGRRTPIVDDIGEVRYGSEQLPGKKGNDISSHPHPFSDWLREKEGVYCATKGSEKMERLKKEVPALTVLWHNDVYYLVKLK